jgi:hypothetical protein
MLIVGGSTHSVRRLTAIAFSAVVVTLLFAAEPAYAQRRVALVIGINDYPRLKTAAEPDRMQLAKAVPDANTIGAVLKTLNFDVDVVTNPDLSGFVLALERTKRKIRAGDTFFFFFAGHGIANEGSNLLLPSDIPPLDPNTPTLVSKLAIPESDIIKMAQDKGAGLVLLTLDACRNNPLEELARAEARAQGRTFRSLGSMRSIGLDTRPTSGIFSIYSAGFGQRALDSLSTDDPDPNSVFTRVFAKKIVEKRHLADIMDDVTVEVSKLAATITDPETSLPHQQDPAHYNQIRGSERRVFLAGTPPAMSPIATAPGAVTPPVEICAVAGAHWRSAEQIGSRQAFEDHLVHFPSCAFAGLARARIASLAAPPPANPCAAARDHWQKAERISTAEAFGDHVRQFGNCAFAALARQKIAALETRPLPTPKGPAGGVPEVSTRAFDGAWYSPEWKYGYTLRNGVGTATSSNSTKFKPGDVIIRLRATGTNTFAGEQIYRNGVWHRISGTLRSDGNIYIDGDKNVSWVMRPSR